MVGGVNHRGTLLCSLAPRHWPGSARLCSRYSGSQYPIISCQTRVLVTHNLSFLPQMDMIIVLANGQVAEVGSYEALMQRNGSFANFLCSYAPEEEQQMDSSTGNPPTPELPEFCLFWNLQVSEADLVCLGRCWDTQAISTMDGHLRGSADGLVNPFTGWS